MELLALTRTDISFIDCAVCIVIYDDTTVQYNTSNKTSSVYKMFFWLFVCKKTPVSVFEQQFWCHFHHILPRYHSF